MSIFANAIAPSAYFWPGVLPLMLGMAFPATVLAAGLANAAFGTFLYFVLDKFKQRT